MNNREDERELLDQIGEVDGKYVDESAYSKQELNRLKEHDMLPATKVHASNVSTETAETPIVFGAMNQMPVPEEEVRAKDDHRVRTILRITIGVSLAAAAILLFVFLWNPDRGRDIATTTEETTSEETTSLADETTAATISTTVADTTTAESTTAPVTTAEETEAIEPNIPLTAEYFPDEGFRRFVSQFDQDQDGFINPEERRAVTEIQCGFDSSIDVNAIHSLAGIQYFSELKSLNCVGLDLTELDVSHNPGLEVLYCSSLGLTQLDLSHNPELKVLDCSGLESLTELDVTQNHKLEVLNCCYSGLTELDLSHNSELKRLYCHSLDLTELDVSHNLELELLDCHDLGLTELDVTHNRKLADLYCENNKLTALDLSNNVALYRLECYNNQLTSLDLSANQELVNLKCAGNSMSELNLSGLSKLEIVECFCNPSLKVNASNCSSSMEISIDATASISGNSDNYKIRKRYDFAPTEDGYYSAKLTEKEWTDLEWEAIISGNGFDYSAFFEEASADQNTLTIQNARLLSDSGDYYDCGTASIPLASTVKYVYTDIYGKTSDYKAKDFNTFYSAMLAEYKNCFSEDTTGELKLVIHILGGSIDEISVQVDQYP